MDAGEAGFAYLQHLTDDDLALLATVTGGGPDTRLRARPRLVGELLGHPAVFASVLGPGTTTADPMLLASPALVFAVAVHRVAAELRDARFVEEWTGPGRRLPVFDVDALRGFLEDPLRRFFLVELLASYTHVSSGAVWVRTRRGWRRRRFSELDPMRMAQMLDVVPEIERPGVYRRLGDLALFLTGVFPDHAAKRALHPVEAGRLARAAGLAVLPETSAADRSGVGLLEELGARWYRLATASAQPGPTGSLRVVRDVADRFRDARRVLNLVTDRHLFRFRERWFSPPRS